MATPGSGQPSPASTTESIPSFEEFVAAQEGETDETAETTDETESAEESDEDTGEEADATEARKGDPLPDWAEAFEKSNGDLSVLPPALRSKVEDWNKAYQRNMTRLGMARAEYERKLEELAAPKPTAPAAATAAEGAPEIDDSSPEAFKKSVAKLAEWIADQKVNAAKADFSKNTQPVAEQVKELAVQADDVRRTSWVRSQEGYSPEVEAKILELGQNSKMWAAAYWDDEGLPELFNYAKSLVSSTNKNTTEAKRKADLPRRVVTPPNGKGSTRAAAPADALKGKTYAQIAEETFKQMYGDGGPLAD